MNVSSTSFSNFARRKNVNSEKRKSGKLTDQLQGVVLKYLAANLPPRVLRQKNRLVQLYRMEYLERTSLEKSSDTDEQSTYLQ